MQVFVIMGVSGCGKSSVGAAVASRIGADFVDGDDLHPRSNVEKMANGTPLNDDDRAPWLAKVGAVLAGARKPTIIGCSALKRMYRDMIRSAAERQVQFLFLSGSRDVLLERMGTRPGHFMPVSLLDSQLATLEAPEPDEKFYGVDIDQPFETVVDQLVIAIEGQ